MSIYKSHSQNTNTPPIAGRRDASRATSSSHPNPQTCAQLTRPASPDPQSPIRSLAGMFARLSQYDDRVRDYLDPENPPLGPFICSYRAARLAHMLAKDLFYLRVRPGLVEIVDEAWFDGGFAWRDIEECLQFIGL